MQKTASNEQITFISMHVIIKLPCWARQLQFIIIVFLYHNSGRVLDRCWKSNVSWGKGMEKSQNNLKLFENKKIRYVWNAEEEEWYFSVVDIV